MVFPSTMIPLTDRTNFAYIAEHKFKKLNRAMEVGAYMGNFAAHNLRQWTGKYYMCDTWDIVREDDKREDIEKERPHDKNGHNGLDHTLKVTSFAKERVHPIKGFSTAVAAKFPDEYFDWIYIDAMHDYKNVADDLRAWFPKLRKGGLLSGDDFWNSDQAFIDYEQNNHAVLNDEELELIKLIHTGVKPSIRYTTVATKFKWGVSLAVLEFSKQHHLLPHVTFCNDKYPFPAWYLVK